MKWQGRRQSTNVEDIRGVNSVTLYWRDEDYIGGYKGHLLIATDGYRQNLSENMIIDKDGWVFTQNLRIELEYVSSWFSNPTMTPAQKESLREVMKIISLNTFINVKIRSESADLVEIASSMYRSMR